MRIATLATVAGWAIALSAPTALGQLPFKYDFSYRWHGWVTCTATGHSPSHSDYTNQETHHWEIMPVAYAFDDISGLRTWYWASWAVTGSGSNADFSWTTNGSAAWDVLQFWVPSLAAPGRGSTLNIEEASPPAYDSFGTTVKNEVDGTLSKARVDELPFSNHCCHSDEIREGAGIWRQVEGERQYRSRRLVEDDKRKYLL